MELSDWVINTLERTQKISRAKASANKLKAYILEKLHYDSTRRCAQMFKRLINLFIDTCKIGLFYLTMIKDFALISILLHASKHILLSRFETVAGYDMDKVIYYLMFVVGSSKLALVIHQLANWKVFNGFCYSRSNRSHMLIKVCTIVFPLHFAILELTRLKFLNRDYETELKKVFNDIKKKEDEKKTKNRFNAVLHRMKGAKQSSVIVHKMYIQLQLTSTILERMPLCAILASLFIACKG